jgi:uncharacterized membrane protein HdeD (DUF308 family)
LSRVIDFVAIIDAQSRSPTWEAIMSMSAGAEEPTFPWWLVLLEGIFAGIFGLLLLTAPAATLLFLVQVFGFYLFLGGIFRLVSIFTDSSSWGWKLVGGLLGIIAGIVVLQHSILSTLIVPTYVIYIIGFLAIAEGVFELIAAFQGSGWGLGILGILRMVFGIILVLNPLLGVIALPFVLGAFMLVGGIFAVVASLRMHRSPAATGE